MQTSSALDHGVIKHRVYGDHGVIKKNNSKSQYLNLSAFVCTGLRLTLLECVEAVWFFPGLLWAGLYLYNEGVGDVSVSKLHSEWKKRYTKVIKVKYLCR